MLCGVVWCVRVVKMCILTKSKWVFYFECECAQRTNELAKEMKEMWAIYC